MKVDNPGGLKNSIQPVNTRQRERMTRRNAFSTDGLRTALLLVLFLGFTVLVVSRFSDARDLFATLASGLWPWVLVGVVIHSLYFSFYAVLYQIGFSVVGVRTRAYALLPVVFASLFVNAVAPLGGAGGAALFINHVGKRGESGGRAAIGLILVLIADLATLIPFMIIGLFYLYQQDKLQNYDLVGGGIYLFFIGGLVFLMLLSTWQQENVRLFLNWVRRVANHIGAWFKRPGLLDQDWADHNTRELNLAAHTITSHPRQLTLVMLWGFMLHVLNLIGLYAFFLAFRQPVSLGGLVAGFVLGIVFFIVSFIPQGVGAVEGIMALVYTSLGIPSAKAIAIALVFRGVNFWLPLLVGLLLIRRITAPIKEIE
jgi:uncharacterized protein (TIRG00374 family)